MKLKSLNQQVIVITGASSGIGLTTAETAARKGAKVVLAARSEETLVDISRRLAGAGGNVIAVACDVGIRAEVDRVANEAIKHFGRIDSWVNNAGGGIYARLDEASEDDNRKLFDTNFWGVVIGSLAALPHLKRQGGALINVGSELSEAAAPLLGMYTATKHAVKGFTDALRIEIEDIDKAPVSITLIMPSAVDTPFPQHSRNYMTQEPKLPGPMMDPQEVADAILDAATKPTRSKKVGTKSIISTLMAMLVPSLGDKAAKKEADKMHYAEPPRHPEGALCQPGEASQSAGQTHGAGGREA
jgi:short-subunit dehydrogenase